MEEDKLKKIAELREILEDRVRILEVELEGMRTLLEFVNNLLLEQSFKRVDVTGLQPIKTPTFTPKRVVQFKARDGEPLATIYIGKGLLQIVPASDKVFTVSTPPFMPFLHDRVFLKIRERDEEFAKIGKISHKKIFSFIIEKDGDVIRRITLNNVAPERERELISAIQWTLEKMYEKMKRTTG